MLTNQTVAATLLLVGMTAGTPAQAGETNTLTVEAFSQAGVPIDTQTTECSLLDRDCRVAFKPADGGEHVNVSVREQQPGVLAVTAEQGLTTVASARLPNERGTTAEVRPSDWRLRMSKVPLMWFRVTWE